MSSQIIPLKAGEDSRIRAEFRPWRPLAFELQRRGYAAWGTSSAFSCVEIRAMLDESIAQEKHHRARAQREEGLRARLRERGKTAVELGEPCGCGSAISLRQARERRVELRAHAELRCNPPQIDDLAADRQRSHDL